MWRHVTVRCPAPWTSVADRSSANYEYGQSVHPFRNGQLHLAEWPPRPRILRSEWPRARTGKKWPRRVGTLLGTAASGSHAGGPLVTGNLSGRRVIPRLKKLVPPRCRLPMTSGYGPQASQSLVVVDQGDILDLSGGLQPRDIQLAERT